MNREMAPFRQPGPDRRPSTVPLGGLGRARRWLMRLLMGRRFVRTLERNQAAADHLDKALKEFFSA